MFKKSVAYRSENMILEHQATPQETPKRAQKDPKRIQEAFERISKKHLVFVNPIFIQKWPLECIVFGFKNLGNIDPSHYGWHSAATCGPR